jgi:xylulokinase
MAVADLVIGVDAGTSSVKVGVFTLRGELVALETTPYGLSSPEPDSMEQDGEEWWCAMAATLRRALERSEGRGRPIAIAIGGQAPTFIAVDAEMRPVAPAVTWLDQRPNALADRIYARMGQDVPMWGSWPAEAGWFACAWPESNSRARWYLGCPDYLAARLTRTASFCYWIGDDEIDAAELDRARLAPFVEPGTVIGRVHGSAAETGLPAGTPVVAGMVDGIMGVLGSGAREPGDACMNGGTSGTFSTICEPPIGFTMVGLRIVGGGAVNTSGKALDWFARQAAPRRADLGSLLDEAAAAPPGSDGLLFLPHLAGERSPVRDANARAAWVGLTLQHDRHHMLRALLEGVAFSFRSLQMTIEATGAEVRDIRSVGGQARSNLWNQIKADVMGHPILVPEVVEASVTGAAILASRGVHAFDSDAAAVSSMVHIVRQLEPDMERSALYAQLFETYCGLYPALKATNWRLHEFAAPRTAAVV